MADLDEDAALTSSPGQLHDDHDAEDDAADFRFLAALNSKSGQLPKRGEKDFEPHGTKHQDGILAASRQAMHEVLEYTRIHTSKQDVRAFFYGEEAIPRDDIIPEEWRQGLDADHIVLVELSKGPHFRTMGKMSTGTNRPGLWLLPEEALFLVERGNMDLWWPGRSSFTGIPEEEREHLLNIDTDKKDEGIPMSLQEAYAMLIGRDGEKGKVSLERYTVYANLKRNGYVVLRAPDWDPEYLGAIDKRESMRSVAESQSVFTWIFGYIFAQKDLVHIRYGPLVRPGMYRSYNAIYQQFAIIPRHKPSSKPESPAPAPEDPYRLSFLLWKPSRIPTFAKSNPGVPDFRVAVIDARLSPIPSLTQVTYLLESTPWNPPQTQLDGPGIGKIYQRLKHGWRNVILAVIDQGVISYLQLCEGGFGEEKLFEKFDGGNSLGNSKRGGGTGRGRGGRGRGRGRGRS